MYSIQRSVVQAAVKFVTSAAVNAKKKSLFGHFVLDLM